MRIEATAPTRIDLAGGTLDIYPLYLFLEGGITVNAGIDLVSKVTVETKRTGPIVLRSLDTGAEAQADSVDALSMGGPMGFVARVVRFYPPKCPVTITTQNTVPHGSGLGASSSLLIALGGALNELNGTGYSHDQFVDWGANVEAQCIGIPTGKQDYYAALRGRVNAIWFEIKGNRVEPLADSEEALAWLEQRVVLTFTGESHFSGTSNWNMLKAHVESLGNNRACMQAIKETAFAMRDAILARDLSRFAALVDREWQNRKQLAEGVTTSQIDRLMQAARDAGALASKICGAGGGGCMISAVGSGVEKKVARALEQAGARHLPFRISRTGLQVTTSE
jgi:D-glycero-alpha-D-manno-heptose-7-phosphate kinase